MPSVWRGPSLVVVAQAAVVAAAQVGGSFGAAEDQVDRRALDALAVALLLVGPAALAFRERRPHLSAVVAFAATAAFLARGHPYGPVFLSPLVGLSTAGLTPDRRRTWATGAAGAAALVAAELVDEREPGASWLHLALLVAWFAAVLAVAEVVRTRREQAAERQRVVQEGERRRASEQRLRVAQELHDVLAHDISLINVQAGVALHLIDEQPEQARTALANIKGASKDALQELRSALDVLRDEDGAAPRAPAPRLDALDSLAEGVRAGGLDVRLEAGPLPPLPAAVEVAAYRIVQEALTNATRHARATTVHVRVGFDGGDVVVEVADDGIGGAPLAGNGIDGMRERAAGVGGTLTAGPAPGGGFRVAARLPRSP